MAKPSPQLLYVDVVRLWREAGAGALDGIEALLTATAFVGAHPEEAELTHSAWSAFCNRLWGDMAVEDGAPELDRVARRTPGLLEQTRRVVASATSEAAGVQQFVHALVEFLAHGPQAGLRRAMPGLGSQPTFLVELFRALLGPSRGRTVYVPSESSGWLAALLASAGWRVAAELHNAQVVRIFKLLARLGDWHLDVRIGDPIRSPAWHERERLQPFDCAAAVVAFGMRGMDDRNPDDFGRFPFRFLLGESYQLSHLLAQSRGTVLAVLPDNFLFRTAGAERDYKEQLVRSGTLMAVIRLPRHTFAPDANIQTSLLVLDAARHKAKDIVFVDGAALLHGRSSGSSRRSIVEEQENAVASIVTAIKSYRGGSSAAVVGYEEIAANAFNLSVERYVRSDAVKRVEDLLQHSKTIELQDIAEIIRPQAYPNTEDHTDHEPLRFAEIGLSDVGADGAITGTTKTVAVAERHAAKVARYGVRPGDLLLSVRGRIGAVGMIEQVPEQDGSAGCLASQAFVILRLRDASPIRSLPLYRYLASPLGQGLLHSVAGGTTVPMVSMGDLKRLKIMVPTPAEEQEISRQQEKARKLRAQIAKLEQLTNELDAAAWPMTKTTSNRA